MNRRHRTKNPPSPASKAAARERRYDAIRRNDYRTPNPPITARRGVLCYDAESGELGGDPASPFDRLRVELADLFESSMTVLVRHADLPNGELVVPLCGDRVSPAAAQALVARAPGPVGPQDLVARVPPPVEPQAGCCIDEATGLITCPGGTEQWHMHGRTVPLVTMGCYDAPDGTRVCSVSMGDAQVVLPVCPVPDKRTPPREPPPPPGLPDCCFDEDTGTVSCPDPNAQIKGIMLDGFRPPPGTWSCYDADDGTRRCTISAGGDDYWDFPACPKPPDLIPPPPRPPECCYDVATGTLRCVPTTHAWHGLEVDLLTMTPQPDGSVIATVMSEQLRPNTTMRFPICDDQVVDCCYDATTETLVCPGNELDGAAAGIVAAWTDPDGQIFVWAAWEGGGARMPLCPGQEECPPVFCCINIQTMAYVCPGRAELNGQAAPIAELVTDNGYNWAVLEDGTRVPLCGERCPPPQLCPDCPTCPPGQWMSPDGTCSDPPECPPPEEPCPPGLWRDPSGACVRPPQCPQCPPGTLLNTQTMQCVRCPPTTEPPCCDSCANGGPCTGCDSTGSSGGHRRRRHGGAMFNPGMGGPKRGGSKHRKRAAGPSEMVNPVGMGGPKRGGGQRHRAAGPGAMANPYDRASRPRKRRIFSGN